MSDAQYKMIHSSISQILLTSPSVLVQKETEIHPSPSVVVGSDNLDTAVKEMFPFGKLLVFSTWYFVLFWVFKIKYHIAGLTATL